jgi:hypothetical protein
MDPCETIKRNGFVFCRFPGGWEVHCQNTSIGKIITTRETSGRHAFRLEWDERRQPRCYRGMVAAAKALKAIASIMHKCKGQRPEVLIIQAWEEKPGGSL